MTQQNKVVDSYLSDFNRIHPSGNGEPGWLGEIRQEAIDAFSSLGFPTTRDEAWRFTNIAPLLKAPFRPAARGAAAASDGVLDVAAFQDLDGPRLVFVDGFFASNLSMGPTAVDGVEIRNLASALSDGTECVEKHLGRYAPSRQHAFSALNAAFMADGAYVHVPAGKVVESPIHLIYVSTVSDDAVASYPRNLIVAGANSQATIVERYLSSHDGVYFTNSTTEIVLEENAVVDHVKVGDESQAAFHMANLAIYQERQSRFASGSFALGGAVVRNDIQLVLNGEGAEGTLNGLYLTRGSQLVDNHTRIEHAQPHCNSYELYKGILDDTSSAVFNGRILVKKHAQKTDAKQSNKNLLLSKTATVNTNPELEIFADDVRCTHGATIGNLDENQLFYLRARGIDTGTARNILTYGFAGEVIATVRNQALREALDHWMFPHLPPSARVSARLN